MAVDFILRCAHSWIPFALYSFDGYVPSQWSYSYVTPLVADSRVAVEALLTLSALWLADGYAILLPIVGALFTHSPT